MDLQNQTSEENADWYTVARPKHVNVFIRYMSLSMFTLTLTNSFICLHANMFYQSILDFSLKVFIDWIVFYAASAIFYPRNGGDYHFKLKFQFSFVFLAALKKLSPSKSSETVFCMQRGLLSLTRGTN